MSYTNYNMDTSKGGGHRNKILLAPGSRMDSLFTPTAAQGHALGRILEADDGSNKKWRYCKNGGAALVKALMTVSPVQDAQALAIIQTAYGASAGATKLNCLITTGNALTDHELADGTLFVNDGGTAMGDSYLIKDNYWVTSDTVISIEIADQGGLRNAIAATDDLTFLKYKCHEVIVAPTTQTNGGPAVGVPNVAVPINYFFWAQYKGWCPMILDTTDTIVVGEPVGRAGTLDVAGCVGLVANDGTDAVWGVCAYASTNAEAAIVDLD